MTFETVMLTDLIGTEIRTNVDTLLRPDTAREVRRLLLDRGVILFRGST